MSPHVLSQNVWTSVILPMTPLRIICSVASCVGCDEIWMPICETSRFSRAAAASMRVSRTVVASGFCTYTCLPYDIAAIAMGACMWSGVDTLTESRLSASLCSSSRQSWYTRTFGNSFLTCSVRERSASATATRSNAGWLEKLRMSDSAMPEAPKLA